MKKIIIFIPFILFAQNFTEIKNEIINSTKYKIQQKKIEIYQQKLNSIKAINSGKLEFSYSGVYFFDTPKMKLTTLQPVAVNNNQLIYKKVSSTLPMSDNTHYIAEIKYSYPIFSGYAISNMIKQSKLNLIKEKLKLKNLKRVLTIQAAKIYSNIYALNQQIKALKTQKEAILNSKKKAEGLYKAELLDKSNLDEIDAKYFETIAMIQNIKANKNSLLEMLSYLINKKVNKIENIKISHKNFTPNFLTRSDIKAIKQTLKIADTNIKIAKSKLYPSINFAIALKKEADTPLLDKNDYQNIDKSYAGISINYNIFDGGEIKSKIEIAKLTKLTNQLFFQDYLNQIKTEYSNLLNQYNALFYQLNSAKKEIIARQSYYEYIKAKFDEGLADVSDLTTALAKLTASKAKKEIIKSKIFFIQQQLELNKGE